MASLLSSCVKSLIVQNRPEPEVEPLLDIGIPPWAFDCEPRATVRRDSRDFGRQLKLSTKFTTLLELETTRLLDVVGFKLKSGRVSKDSHSLEGRGLLLMDILFDRTRLGRTHIWNCYFTTDGETFHGQKLNITRISPDPLGQVSRSPRKALLQVLEATEGSLWQKAHMTLISQSPYHWTWDPTANAPIRSKTALSISYRQDDLGQAVTTDVRLQRIVGKEDLGQEETKRGLPSKLKSLVDRAEYLRAWIQSLYFHKASADCLLTLPKVDNKDEDDDAVDLDEESIALALEDTIMVGIDIGFNVDIAAEAFTFDYLDRPVQRSFKWKGTKVFRHKVQSTARSDPSKPPPWPGPRNRTTTSREASAKRKAFRERELSKAVVEILELAGIMAASTHRSTSKRAGWSTLSSGRKGRRAIIVIGDAASHPGSKRGVHRDPLGNSFIRLLKTYVESHELAVELIHASETNTSRTCPNCAYGKAEHME